MPCIILVGGGIGCGKSTLINYLYEHKYDFLKINEQLQMNADFKTTFKEHNNQFSTVKGFYIIQFDDLCSVDEQKQLMKTLRGLRNFRTDLLMAAERFIAFIYKAEQSIAGPLSERSYKLFKKLLENNKIKDQDIKPVIFVEDNFYYRSMRYEWFQVARRTNAGFATIFVHCSLDIAIYRNSTRGYQIPEERIKKIFSVIEYPDPLKYKWEKYSLKFDSSSELNSSSLSEIVNIILEAAKDPAEQIIMEDKIKAQKICSQNVVHQTDKILRKIVSKKILNFKNSLANENNLESIVSSLIKVRQKLLSDVKKDCVHLPEDLVDSIQNLGVEYVLDILEEELNRLFNTTFEEYVISSNLSYLKICE